MPETTDLKRLARRPMEYWNVDGLPELMMGALWITWGSAWLVGQGLPRGRAWNVYWSLVPFLLVASGLASTWATKKLKERITFPRAGYVQWRAPSRRRALLAALVGMLATVTLVLVQRRAGDLETIAGPAAGCVLGTGLVLAAWTQRMTHLLGLAAAALVLGFALGAWRQGWDAVCWLLVALGAATMIVGALRLRMFVRRNPVESAA